MMKDHRNFKYKFDTIVAPHEGSDVLYGKLKGKFHSKFNFQILYFNSKMGSAELYSLMGRQALARHIPLLATLAFKG
jgi:hypothetical protein